MGFLASADLAAATVTKLWTVPAGTKNLTINIRAANRTAGVIGYTCWIGVDGAAPVDKNMITPNFPVIGNRPYEDLGFAVSAGESVWCLATAAGLSVRVHGQGA